VRTGHAANSLAIVRHIVMNKLRLNTSHKGSMKTKRMLAATSDTFCTEKTRYHDIKVRLH